jgi:hypothetical protein
MKKQLILLAGLLLVGCFSSCTKEPAILDLEITVDKTSFIAGEEILFTFNGNADFLTFYDGLPANEYNNYPNAGSEIIPFSGGSATFSKTYSSFHGQITATFVASSYGNWSEDIIIEQFDFVLDISDNRTGLISCTLKTPGLFGEEFPGVINDENFTISVSMPTGTNVSKLTTSLISESPLSTIYINDVEFSNKSSVDFSTGSVIFKVVAADGSSQEWTVVINYI